MQRALDRAGLRRRDQFRPRQIDFQEIVGHHAARRPRRGRADDGRRKSRSRSFALPLGHADQIDRSRPAARRPRPRPRGRRTPAPAFAPARGRSVRKVSRTSPSSKVRCTATSVSCGWLHSDSAKATSSSAAAPPPAIGRAEIRDQMLRQHVDHSRRGRLRSPPRSAPASTSRARRRREIRRGMPSAPCLPAPPDRGPRTRRRRTPPIRPARPPSRTRKCPKYRAGWCATASRARPLRRRIEPGGRRRAAASSFLRSTSALPMRRTSRSPFSSMSRRRPCSTGSRSR